MPRRCPNCRSLNVRRSSRGKDGDAQSLLRSPYRCRDCGEKFWVVARRIYRRIGAALAINVAFFGLIGVLVVLLAD